MASLSSCSESESTDADGQTPRGSWASLDLRSSVSDSLIPGLLQGKSPELVDQSNEEKRFENREVNFFFIYKNILISVHMKNF